jgi:predicted membrane channel-forming protein YqfA (hemolysin III family)
MGWAVLSNLGLLLSLPASVVALLVAGGVFYTVGITFHLARVLPGGALALLRPRRRPLPLRRRCVHSGLKGRGRGRGGG